MPASCLAIRTLHFLLRKNTREERERKMGLIRFSFLPLFFIQIINIVNSIRSNNNHSELKHFAWLYRCPTLMSNSIAWQRQEAGDLFNAAFPHSSEVRICVLTSHTYMQSRIYEILKHLKA